MRDNGGGSESKERASAKAGPAEDTENMCALKIDHCASIILLRPSRNSRHAHLLYFILLSSLS